MSLLIDSNQVFLTQVACQSSHRYTVVHHIYTQAFEAHAYAHSPRGVQEMYDSFDTLWAK